MVLNKKKGAHPILKRQLSFGERAADKLTTFAGSWKFIIILFIFIIIWITLNMIAFLQHWDPWPFIILNLTLSCLAAIQAPIILMSQNRQAQRDRMMAKYDYSVNRKAEREIEGVKRSLDYIKKKIGKSRKVR